ncbi:hypothetical protein BH20VER1_BH20VER1_31170 [soil metagenome]
MSKSANKRERGPALPAGPAGTGVSSPASPGAALLRQGWISLALWIAFGILLEGFNAFRSPAYLDDATRRDLFRLAHAHGTLLNMVLLVAAICARLGLIRLNRMASLGLQSAVVLLPAGFFFAGLFRIRDEPGVAILLVPVGAVLLLVSAIYISLTLPKR